MKLVITVPGNEKLIKHLRGIPAFVKKETRAMLQAVGEAARDAQIEALIDQQDLEGGALRPNSSRWSEYKTKKFGSTAILAGNEKYWLFHAVNWIVKVMTHRDGQTTCRVWPKHLARILGYLMGKGYTKSFGIHPEIPAAMQDGTLLIGQEAIERFGTAATRLGGGWRGKGIVVRGSKRNY